MAFEGITEVAITEASASDGVTEPSDGITVGGPTTEPSTRRPASLAIPPTIAEESKGESKEGDFDVVGIVLDASSSMSGTKEATISGLNEFVDSQLAAPRERPLFFAILYFSDYFWVPGNTNRSKASSFSHTMIPMIPSDSMKRFASRESPDTFLYSPHGNTALNDAIGFMIRFLDASKVGGGTRSLVIQTDGVENASSKFTEAMVKTSVEKRCGRGWNVFFLKAGKDATRAGERIGVAAGNCIAYTQDGRSEEVWVATSAAVSRGRAGGITDFTEEESESTL